MMKKRIEKAGSVLLIALCMGIYCGYASGQSNENIGKEQEVAEVLLSGEELVSEEQETEEITPEEETEAEAFPQVILTEEEQEIAESTWANSQRSRIAYMDGYYYYSSQSDHYYLYRVKEDGSEPQCLAKIHPGSICAQDGYVYFINQSDGHGIYRIMADGTGMEKLYEDGHNLQISDDYVFFCSSSYEETLETTGVIVEGQKNGGLYRMKKDGSERELIAEDVWSYVLSDGYSQETQNMDIIYYSKTEKEGMTVYKMGINGQTEEELCHFGAQGNLTVFGGNLFCIGKLYLYRKRIYWFNLENGEMNSLAVPEFTDGCIYKGYFYGLCEHGEEEREEEEQEEEVQVEFNIYRLDLSSGDIETLYEDTFQLEDWYAGIQPSDLYAAENGIFFRRFVSKEDGCRWFRLTEDGDMKEFEDRENVPVTLPADYVEHLYDAKYITSVLDEMSTEGYETYLADDLRYEEYFSVDKDGEPANRFLISLPQFSSKIAGYQKINSYFQNVYQEVLQEKDVFSELFDGEPHQDLWMYFQYAGYGYVYVGEDYITVEIDANAYPGWEKKRKSFQPVTFDRASGEVVSLEEILGMTTQETVARLTGAVYKYKEGIRSGEFFLQEGNLLTNEFNLDNFLLFSQGIGIYYPEGAIGPYAVGDSLFIVPWEDLR